MFCPGEIININKDNSYNKGEGSQGNARPNRLVALPTGRVATEHRPKDVGDLLFFHQFFWHFATAGQPANAPVVPSAPLWRVGANFGTVGAMMPLNLIWLVHGGYWAK